MINIENKIDNPSKNIESKLSKLSQELPSIQEERLIDFCSKSPEKQDLDKICTVLNKEYESLLWEQWFNFKQAFSKIKSPVWKIS